MLKVSQADLESMKIRTREDTIMLYTEPKIINVVDGISAIQSVNSDEPIKPSDTFLDQAGARCTQGAYEADE